MVAAAVPSFATASALVAGTLAAARRGGSWSTTSVQPISTVAPSPSAACRRRARSRAAIDTPSRDMVVHRRRCNARARRRPSGPSRVQESPNPPDRRHDHSPCPERVTCGRSIAGERREGVGAQRARHPPATAHRDPSANCSGLVSGLWSGATRRRTGSAPSQVAGQPRGITPSSSLHYRCGGSAGFSPASQFSSPRQRAGTSSATSIAIAVECAPLRVRHPVACLGRVARAAPWVRCRRGGAR